MNKEELDFTDARMLRVKAEEKLTEKTNKTGITEGETDTQKLLHELQVHQIELEMQNEELRRAYEITESALKRYTMLYDFAPMGYFTITPEGSIRELNFTGAEILRYPKFSLIDSNLKLYISKDTLPVFNAFLTKVFVSNTKESCKVKLESENNTTTSVYMEGIVVGDDRQCLLSVVVIAAK